MTEGRLRWFLLAGVLLGALGLGALRMVTGFGVTPDPTPAPTASPSYPAAWRAYSPPDGSFRVVAPTPPKEQAASTNAGTLHRVDFPPPGDGAWFVEWLDVDPTAAAGRTDADLVDMALSTMPDRLGAQIDEEDLLKDGPFPGVELQLSDPAGKVYLIRVFAKDGRLVEAAAELGPGEDRALAERFVASLELSLS